MKFLLPTALCLLLSLSGLSQVAAVQQATKVGSVSGTLTRYGSGEPLRNAEVSLSRTDETTATLRVTTGSDDSSSASSQQVTVITDANGQFRFPSVAPGEYALTVRKNGFHGFRTANSQTWMESFPLTISPGQSITDLALAMQPGSVISGKVSDEEGDPMAYVQVTALKWAYASHRRQLRPIGTATTDDQGSYRIFGLEPGSYIVRANVMTETGESRLHYAPSYYPDATSPANASAVNVRAGDQGEADFRMARVATARITGHLSGSVQGGQTQIYLRNLQDEGSAVMRAATGVDRNGNFTLDGVMPGDYVLGAVEFRGDSNEAPRHAELPLKVDGSDIPNLALSLEDPGHAVVQGTLRIEGGMITHPRLDSLRVAFLPADDSNGLMEFAGAGGYAAVKPNGTLRLDNVPPGKYVLSLTAEGNGWEDFYTKDVQLGGRDVTDSTINFTAASGVVPITVTVGIDGAFVEGTVLDDDGHPVANATVVGVPDPSLRGQFDLYQRATTDQNGQFTLRGIKPGAYSLYAWNTMDDESYMDPEFLRRYENARTDVTLAPKEHQAVKLKLLSSDEQ